MNRCCNLRGEKEKIWISKGKRYIGLSQLVIQSLDLNENLPSASGKRDDGNSDMGWVWLAWDYQQKKTRIRNVQSGLTKYTYQAIFFSLISFYITGSYCQSATRYITFYNVCHDNISYQSNWQFSIRHRLVVSTLLWAHDLLSYDLRCIYF